MDGKQEFVVLEVDKAGINWRLDAWIAHQLPQLSRSKVQKLIADGHVLRNGKACKAKDALAEGDVLQVTQVPAPPMQLEPLPLPLDIVFEDADVLVVNKPSGLSVHPGAGAQGPTLVQGLLYHAGQLGGGTWERPGIVHRLDKDTSGLLVCAKTELAHRELARQFHDKTNIREYRALLDGVIHDPIGRKPCKELSFESFLQRDPRNRLRFLAVALDEPHAQNAKWAKSQFTTLHVYAHRLSLVKVKLFTGRTHQIRAHARALGSPVWGDSLYARPRDLPQVFTGDVRQVLQQVGRQLLHAHTLGFKHPRTGETLCFEAPLPSDFQQVLQLLAPYQI